MSAALQPWANGPWLAFDLETSGVDVASDRIVTATLLHIEGSNIDAHNWLVDPGVEIPDGAARVHGITTDYARQHGVAPVSALAEIADVLGKHWTDACPLVAMNASFDLTLLDAELRRHRDERLRVAGPVLDPRVLDKAVDPYRKGSRKLHDLCLHYGVQLDNAHTSHDDALAAARLVFKLARHWPEIGTVPLAELHERQIAWHDQQAQSLQAYFDRQPGRVEHVDRGWPLRKDPTS